MRSLVIAIAVGLLGTAAAIGVVLSEHPLTVIATNSTSASQELGGLGRGRPSICQAGERLPRGTRAIRLSLGEVFTGPSLSVAVFSKGRAITSGARGSDWSGSTVTTPVRALPHAVAAAKICFTTGQIAESVGIFGTRTAPAVAARSSTGIPLTGRLRVEFLGAANSSWLAMASSVASNMGLGRAWSGGWVAWWVLALMLLASALVAGLLLRELHD